MDWLGSRRGIPCGVVVLLWVLFLGGCALQNRLSQDEQRIQARLDLAASYLGNDQPRLSMRELAALEHRAQDKARYHYLSGLTARGLDRLPEARRHFQRAVQIQPGYARAWNNLGQVYVRMGQEQKARQAFEQALSIPTYLTPEYPAYNLGRLYLDQGQRDKARQKLQESIGHAPDFVPAILLLSDIQVRGNHLQQAVHTLRQGLRASPKNPRLMLALAENLLRRGQPVQARTWFEDIVRTAPDSQPAQVATDYLALLPE